MNDNLQWIAFKTIVYREINRFTRIWVQTLVPPAITMALYFLIFGSLIGSRIGSMDGFSYMQFVAPGLIMMSVLQQAFAHTSSSLLISKIQGNIVDILLPPLGEIELNIAISLGGVTRGIIVAIGAVFCMYFFVSFSFSNIFAIIFYLISGSLMLSSIGIITGIWAEKFDHLGTITNFIIVPLSFLSGTFYSVKKMPEFAIYLIEYNPFFYVIDGFRYGFIGKADGDLIFGAIFLTILNLILIVISHFLLKSGWRLKT